MVWPAQSLDVNPIELLWDELNRQVKQMRITSEISLWNCSKQVWNNLKVETLRKLVERMPRICAAIIEARGGYLNEKTLV